MEGLASYLCEVVPPGNGLPASQHTLQLLHLHGHIAGPVVQSADFTVSPGEHLGESLAFLGLDVLVYKTGMTLM